jgi:hypothetical protein
MKLVAQMDNSYCFVGSKIFDEFCEMQVYQKVRCSIKIGYFWYLKLVRNNTFVESNAFYLLHECVLCLLEKVTL